MAKVSQLLAVVLNRKFLLSRYFIVTLCFFAWMLFFDKYKISNSIYLSRTVSKLEKAKLDYHQKIVVATLERKQLEENSEKYAREKFYMHKENEEVFIIEK